MSGAVLFLIIALACVVAALAALAHAIRDCDECEVPDRHGDSPAIPESLIDEARAEARRRFEEASR